MARKPGRPQGSGEILSRERILKTAIQLIEAQGVEDLSMRKLAAALEVNPMAIYHYFENKEALLMAVVEVVFANFRVPPLENATWEEEVRHFAHTYYALVLKHHRLVMYVVGDLNLVSQATSYVNNESIYDTFFRAGLRTEQEVLDATSVIVDYLHGFSMGERAVQAPTLPRHMSDAATDEFPTIQRVMSAVENKPTHEVFNIDRGLNIILMGIKAMLSASQSAPPPV